MLPIAEIAYPVIDPVLFELGPITVRWYGMAYLIGFLAGWALLRRLASRGFLPMERQAVGDLITTMVIGVLLGGRIGYVGFYKPGWYFEHPGEVIAIWDGGMSFHGGLLGTIAAVLLFARRRRLPATELMDAVALACTPGLFFGRLANFVNGELWGRPSDVPWAMVFPDDVLRLPRHPSQLYEALLEGALLLILLSALLRVARFRRRGAIAASFVIGYGVARFLVEFAREPDQHLGTVLWGLSLGQFLCLGMVAAGVIWLARTQQGDGVPSHAWHAAGHAGRRS
jgi:phosphatidylglycerol:prolipoprotein diacylglycerol transferase